MVFHCVPKSLIWHYSNLALLYVSNTVNIAFILMILISKSQLRDFSNNISYCLLIIEFISFLAIMLLFLMITRQSLADKFYYLILVHLQYIQKEIVKLVIQKQKNSFNLKYHNLHQHIFIILNNLQNKS